MIDMDKIARLRQEIKRRKGYISVTHFAEELLSFLDTLSEEPDKSLEEEISRTYHDGSVTDTEDIDHVAYENIAHHFAEWQASQMPMPEDTVLFQKGVAEGRRLEREDMLKDAVEGEVGKDGILTLSNGEAVDLCPSLDKIAFGLQPRQKVRIVVLKEEE